MFNRTNAVCEVFCANDAVTAAPTAIEGLSKREKLQVAAISSGAALGVNLGVRLIGNGINAIGKKRDAKKAAKAAEAAKKAEAPSA
jgi:hypothetical protein